MTPSLVVIQPFQLPAKWNLSRPNNITCNNIYIATLSILILNKTYLSGDNYITKL
jgi:hypothetical protein